MIAIGEWMDGSIRCGPDGYTRATLAFRLAERWRRAPGARWFALVGAVERRRATLFAIERGRTWQPPLAGELYCFANDLPFMYWNNAGSMNLTIVRSR